MNSSVNRLFDFLRHCPTCYHVIDQIRSEMAQKGYKELLEADEWTLESGGKYFVVRNESSVIAFRIPSGAPDGFMITASHSDSPSFKIKENPEIAVEKAYVKLNVEKYGGMLMFPWFDRPLSVAGRVIVRDGECGFNTKLIDIDKNLCMIPSLAIHMDRNVNDGRALNPQNDMLPIIGDFSAKDTFEDIIADAADVDKKDIIGKDLFLYCKNEPSVWGANDEFISAGHLDDLECVFGCMNGFFDAEASDAVPVFAVFDNEEVGSSTKQGADSTFLGDTLERVAEGVGKSYKQMIASSFMVSADNAHAVHANYTDKADPVNRPYMNGGIVIKYNANQKYTTDAVSQAVFTRICEMAEVPVQHFTNRSDIAGGSTLGNISNTHVSLNTVDIGLAQLAMHSPYETAGAADVDYLIKAMSKFYSLSFVNDGCGKFKLK